MKILEIERPGSLTTVQDLGRIGYGQYGVPTAGAMDPWSLQIANLLVGSPRNAAGLEMTMLGAKIRFLTSTVVAITGGQGMTTLNGQKVQNWRSIYVKPGDVLDIGVIREGCRAYLAVAGGIKVSEVLGSRSTYIPAQIGGIGGRPLIKSDVLEGHSWEGDYVPRALSRRYVPDYTGICTLRVVPGLDVEMFSEDTLNAFYSATYEVTGQSDRMGCRLQGEVLKTSQKGDRVSDALVKGGIQVPPNGQPIILAADQTIGGYPIIAVVASVDFTLLAQLSVTQKVRFEQISFEEAQSLRLKMENFLQSLAIAVGAPG